MTVLTGWASVRSARRPDRHRATDPAPASLLGVEHEYTLADASGPLDFRSLLHGLPVPGRRLDPGDPNAYRCAFGGVLTCDGREAEVASPPIAGAPGFAHALDAWARTARAELERLLPAGVLVDGYSTHLNATLASRGADRVARRYARTFGAGLMLLVDRRDSPGLLVRPRPGRLELGGEYVAGTWLRAAAAFAAGSTRAAAAGRLPPRLDVAIAPALERYGWYVDRRAFGTDLYRDGRASRLRRARGGSITAQEHLEACWAVARESLTGLAAPDDLRDADLVVAGDLPLPLEHDRAVDDDLAPADLDLSTAAVLVPRVRPGYTVRVEIATWDFTVFALVADVRTAYCCIPRMWLGDFLAELDAGEADDDIRGFLHAAPSGRVLASATQTGAPSLYDRVGTPTALLPSERDPVTGRPLGGGGDGFGDRPGKRESRRAPRPRGKWLVAAAAAATVLVVAIGAVALAGGSDDGDDAEVSAAAERSEGGAAAGVPRAGAGFEPHGTTRATVAFTQDGTFRVTQAITVSPSVVRPGDTVQIDTLTTSTGPSWGRDPTGEFRINCDAGITTNFSRSSTSTVYLSPVGPAPSAFVGGISSGGTPPLAVSADAQLEGAEFRESQQGCDRTTTSDSGGAMTVPLTISPGRYAVVPTWGIYAEFPDQRNQLSHTGGSFPVLTIVRT